MRKKYFYVFNRKQADDIYILTGERYYKFTDRDNKTIYSFINCMTVRKAYRTIKNGII